LLVEDAGFDAGPRVAAVWRRVRWCAVVFCLVQFAAYQPGAGALVAPPVRWYGFALAAALGLVNVVAAVTERRRPRVPRSDGRPAPRDHVLLVVDLAATVAVVELLAFDPSAAVWALLVVPVLEAGLLGRLRCALEAWVGCVAALVAAQVLAVVVGRQPTPTLADLVGLLGYRSTVLLLVALIVGVQARVTHEYVMLLQSAREKLAYEASHDHLTGVANRGLFLRRATRALAAAEARGETVGILYVDCDDFKQVNDQYGHEVGDQVLVEVTRRLVAACRSQDCVARLGGDEFVLLAEGLAEPDEITRLADRLRHDLAVPYLVPAFPRPLLLSCSVGTADDAGPGRSVEQLLRESDAAMYRSKRGRRGAVSV
jgi:diguanylate cyclase (GGDEF)-like protein